jgi:uncharacterized protein YcsI (UPF0317 family)
MSTGTLQATDERAHPASVRQACRDGRHSGLTAGLAPGYAQANLVIVPGDLAYEFLLFAHRNPKPCPVLDVTDIGDPEPKASAPGADLRTDLPRFRVYERGELVDERTDIADLWRDDLVGFLLGCSFTFEAPLIEAGIRMRHIDACRNVPMYRTNIQCAPAGSLAGEMVVSMRMISPDQIVRAVLVTSRFPAVHGAPVHIGDPAAIGIGDLDRPDWGDPPLSDPGDVPVFWACGVTPQNIAMRARPPFMITHAPGHMFVTDLPISGLAVL